MIGYMLTLVVSIPKKSSLFFPSLLHTFYLRLNVCRLGFGSQQQQLAAIASQKEKSYIIERRICMELLELGRVSCMVLSFIGNILLIVVSTDRFICMAVFSRKYK